MVGPSNVKDSKSSLSQQTSENKDHKQYKVDSTGYIIKASSLFYKK